MTNILIIEASARFERSLSRGLSRRFRNHWRALEPDAPIVVRDVTRNPPPFVSEEWIAAAFTPAGERAERQEDILKPSNELIEEVSSADIIVIATPMYNYGMPAALKAWFDQVIRINETFSFDPGRGDWPLRPILSGKFLVVLSSRGEFGFEAGGVREDMNHLDTHIATCAHYLGADRKHTVAIDYQEFGDERHRQSVGQAHRDVDRLVAELVAEHAAAMKTGTPTPSGEAPCAISSEST